MALPAEWKKRMDGWIDPQAGRRQVNGGLLEKLTEKLRKQRSPMTGHLQAGVPRMQEGWLSTSPKTSGPSVTLHSSKKLGHWCEYWSLEGRLDGAHHIMGGPASLLAVCSRDSLTAAMSLEALLAPGVNNPPQEMAQEASG